MTLPFVYSQFDPAWARKLLGFNTDPQFDIYNYGCLLSSLATICKYFGKDETPLSLMEKLKRPEVNGFVKDSGEYIWGSLSKIYPDISEKLIRTPDPLTDAQLTEIRAAIDANLPVMVNIDYNPRTVKKEDHYGILVAYNPNDENDFTFADPLGGIYRSLKSYVGWFNPSVRVTIHKYIIYSGPANLVAGFGGPGLKNTLAENISSPVLPENYNDIIHNSAAFEELSRKFIPEAEPKNVSSADLEDRMRKQLPVNTVEVEKEVIKEIIKEVPVEKVIEKTIEIPAADATHASLQWQLLVEYLELGKIPDDATFEDAKRVIAGFKSAQTDYKNKVTDVLKLASGKDITIRNQEAMISNLTKQVLRNEKLRKAEIDNLMRNIPNFAKLKVQFEATIKEMQGDIDAGITKINELELRLSDKEVEVASNGEKTNIVSQKTDPVTNTGLVMLDAVKFFLNFVKKYIHLKNF